MTTDPITPSDMVFIATLFLAAGFCLGIALAHYRAILRERRLRRALTGSTLFRWRA
jgi:hypothetical protein